MYHMICTEYKYVVNRLSYDVPNVRWPTDVHNLGSRAFPGMAKARQATHMPYLHKATPMRQCLDLDMYICTPYIHTYVHTAPSSDEQAFLPK